MMIVSQKVDMMQEAIRYATEKNWAVFPLHSVDENGICTCSKGAHCENPGKHPKYDPELIPNGLKSATTDVNKIREWWEKWSDANIGMATGVTSGVVVLDVDPDKGGDAALEELEKRYGPLPDTIETITGSGGRHILFKYPDWYVPNSVEKVGPGLDVRGDGGYIVLPPSIHASGNRYEWEIEHHPDDTDLAPIPEWLANKIREKTTRKSQEAKAKVTGRVWERYLQGGPIPEGTRDDTLFRIGCAMRAQGAGYEDILATLTAVNEQRCKPPLDWKQVDQKALQAIKYEPGRSGLLSFPATDAGNAERLADRHGADIKYCAKLNGWHVWDGKRWMVDETGEIMRRALDTVRAYREEAEERLHEIEEQMEQAPANEQKRLEREHKRAENVLRFANSSENRSRLESMIVLAQSRPGIPARPEDFDADPWLLNVNNGTLDLRTGELRDHRREDLITKIVPVDYKPDAKCPRWESFIHEIMDGDEELIRYLQKAVGYSLTGDISEQAFFFLHGAGSNGKSVFLSTIKALMGDYGQQAPSSLLLLKKGEGVPNDVARLKGARFVSTTETEEGKRLAENLVKQLTGGDPVAARFLRQEFFEFLPECKLWLASNHKPIVRGTDHGIWRRIHLIPFTVTIPEERKDKRLPEKLQAELPGILRWAVEGLRMWQEEGLKPPQKVRAATQEYREDMDTLGAFLEECCVTHWDAKVTVSELYRVYCEWCDRNGEKPMKQRMMSKRLKERGFHQEKSTGGQRVWFGLGLSADADDYSSGKSGISGKKSGITPENETDIF